MPFRFQRLGGSVTFFSHCRSCDHGGCVGSVCALLGCVVSNQVDFCVFLQDTKMSKKEGSQFDLCHTSGSGEEYHPISHDRRQPGAEDKFRDLDTSTSLKSSDKCSYNDSGVWSGSNIVSEEISTPESPVSKSGSTSFVSDKVSSDNKSFMRLDSGIDVSVSQQFSELSLKDETYNDLNDPPLKSKESTSGSSSNINEQFVNKQKTTDIAALQRLQLLEACFEQNEDGDTELHLAIIHKFIETVYALVRMVPQPDYLNIRNDDRQTPLHLAVLTRQPRLARLLVCAGADLEVLDRGGNTALHLAVAANDLGCVRAIIDPVTIPETLAAQLQYSPYPFHTHCDIANIHNYDGQTCVHLAATNGNIEILRYLLWFGANINAKEWKGGQTCLHLAVERRDMELCKFLVAEAKIDAEELSYAGHTAYQTAGRGWDAAIAAALCDYGVDTYLSSDEESDDDMSEGSFSGGYQVNGGGLVNVGA